MGVILCHLAGVPSGSEEVEALTSSMASDFSELEPGVTPVMGNWGDATNADDVEASVRDCSRRNGGTYLGRGGGH